MDSSFGILGSLERLFITDDMGLRLRTYLLLNNKVGYELQNSCNLKGKASFHTVIYFMYILRIIKIPRSRMYIKYITVGKDVSPFK